MPIPNQKLLNPLPPEKKKAFTDQQPRVATEKDCKGHWAGYADGFRCNMCGHKFVVGDYWRWVYMNGTKSSSFGNIIVCENCDGDDIVEDRVKWEMEAKTRFWQLCRN